MDEPTLPPDETYGMLPPELPPDEMSLEPEPRGARHSTIGLLVSWIVICVLVVAAVLMNALPAPPPPAGQTNVSEDDAIENVMMRLQAKYLLGVRELFGQDAAFWDSLQQLRQGSVGSRQRFIVLAGEFVSPDEAAAERVRLDEEFVASGLEMTPEQQSVHDLLTRLYPGDADADARAALVGGLTTDEQQMLRDRLDWFGELVLLPADGPDQAGREDLLGAAKTVAVIIVSGVVGGLIAGVLGFGGLITMLVLAIQRKLKSGVQPGGAPHSVYAETFAIWMVLFLGLQIVAGALLVNSTNPSVGLLAGFAVFFMSLVALAWPCMRGVPWSTVRSDIGLTAGRSPAMEPIWGVCGYAMALPILAIGVLLTFVLMALQASFTTPPGEFESASGPAHPIIEAVGSGDPLTALAVLLVAAVAAPVVEEVMFRGVMYRHLRDASRNWGIVLSIVVSTVVNTFVFAIIHPQGWVATPALMALATAFTLMREWRGTVIPSIIMHAVSNGLLMIMLMVVLGS